MEEHIYREISGIAKRAVHPDTALIYFYSPGKLE